MNSAKVLYSPGRNDEWRTPEYAVRPLLQYIPKGSMIWCPFDKRDSAFVSVLHEAGHYVLFSHIDDGSDFYTSDFPEAEFIISNPPFSNKAKIFQRALDLGRPFALLMTLAWLNDSGPKRVFREAGMELQLLMFDERIHYLPPGASEAPKLTTFSSAYYCCDFLPQQIIMDTLRSYK